MWFEHGRINRSQAIIQLGRSKEASW